MEMVIRYILFWFVLLLTAMVNGVLREATYGKYMAELTAHQISTGTGVVLTGLCVWGLSRLWPLESQKQAWTVGILWLVFTLTFEFLFGHYIVGHSWQRLLQDYNLLAGRVWLLFLLWVAIMPYIFYKLIRAKS